MRGIGRGVAGRITLAGRSRCFPWMFKREEKATPRPRFPPRTWGTLRVSLSQENCAVVNSDRPLKIQNQEGRLVAPWVLKELRAKPAADGAPGIGVVADDAEGGGDGDGEKQAHAAPDPAPKNEVNGDCYGVETDAAPDQFLTIKV